MRGIRGKTRLPCGIADTVTEEQSREERYVKKEGEAEGSNFFM